MLVTKMRRPRDCWVKTDQHLPCVVSWLLRLRSPQIRKQKALFDCWDWLCGNSHVCVWCVCVSRTLTLLNVNCGEYSCLSRSVETSPVLFLWICFQVLCTRISFSLLAVIPKNHLIFFLCSVMILTIECIFMVYWKYFIQFWVFEPHRAGLSRVSANKESSFVYCVYL